MILLSLLLVLASCPPASLSAADNLSAIPPISAPATAPPAVRLPPRRALRWRRTVTAAAHQSFGVAGPVAMLAAQIHQESAWNPTARSGVGARGMAQFMPGTAADIARRHPGSCAPANPFDGRWAIICAARYDADLHRAIHRTASPCDRWAMTLSAYNGGLGWVYRDRRLARKRGLNARRWWGQVSTVNAGRSAANWRQNRDYPRRILRLIEPRYQSWGPQACK